MTSAMRILTREEIYELVWTKPLKIVAEGLAITPAELGKLCTRLAVPRPPQGYWVRTLHGKAPARPPLPDPGPEAVSSVSLPDVTPEDGQRVAAHPTAPPEVRVRETLAGAHAAVLELSKHVSEEHRNDHQRMFVVTCDGGQATFRASATNKSRALRILDALCRSVSARGHEVAFMPVGGGRRGHHLVVSSGQDSLRISIVERMTRSDHRKTAEERASEARTGYSWAPKHDYAPSDRLTLELVNRRYYPVLASWSDGALRRIESVLGSVVVRIEEKLVELGVQRLKQEEENQARRDAEKRRELEAVRRQHHDALGKDLSEMTARWSEAARIRDFLAEVASRLETVDLPATPGQRAWLDWAHAYADEIDPMVDPGGIAKVVEPSIR
jgi:hypothetical protein